MDLRTSYLGLQLDNPLMPGASPLVDDLDKVQRLCDAGASAIVMCSLFEEQLTAEQMHSMKLFDEPAESFGEASSFLPSFEATLGPDEYLEQIQAIKRATGLPVIGSLNGVSPGGWLEYARLIEQAGAAALELNVYYVGSDPYEDGSDVEARLLRTTHEVCQSIRIPVAVKLSPYFSSMANLCRRLVDVGARGLVVFNRFYQPDLDLEALEVVPVLQLSQSSELALRIQWLALLSGRVDASLAVTGGVHTTVDVVKSVMAGAHSVQVVSALLRHGPGYLGKLRAGLAEWLEQHEYDSLRQAQGSLSFHTCPDPVVFERGNYAKLLQSWRY